MNITSFAAELFDSVPLCFMFIQWVELWGELHTKMPLTTYQTYQNPEMDTYKLSSLWKMPLALSHNVSEILQNVIR